MKIKQILLVSVGVLTVSAIAFAAVLTPSFNIWHADVFARASFADPTNITFTVNGIQTNVTNARETVVQQIIIGPGGNTGWHSHPGPVVVLIKEGQMSFYDSDDPTCTVRTYSAGQSFIDRGQGDVHIARNESTSQRLELWATYFDVPPGGSFRIDAPNPGNCVGF